MKATEMKMARWMHDRARLDRIRNKYMRKFRCNKYGQENDREQIEVNMSNVERRNNEDIIKISEIKLRGKLEKGQIKKEKANGYWEELRRLME